MRSVDTAKGIWLDYLAARVGLKRPATTDAAQDERFGFTGPTQSRGFDQAPFAGDEANASVFPLGDESFRRLIKARGILVIGDGSCATFFRAVRIIDPGAIVRDNRNMVVDVLTDNETDFEVAEAARALPRNAGVLVRYLAKGAFGFDDAGEGFDQAPFRTA